MNKPETQPGGSLKPVDSPVRVQLSRKRGWKMPANTIRVCLPGYFGNPFKVGRDGDAAACVKQFEEAILCGKLKNFPFADRPRVGWKLYLRGKNLACWCKPGQPCHADVLLRLANAAGDPQPRKPRT